MLQRERQLQAKISKLADALLFGLAFWLTHKVRSIATFDPTNQIQEFSYYAWLLPVIFILTPPLLEAHGFYKRPVLGSRSQLAGSLFKAAIWLTLVVVTLLTLVKQEGARGVVFPFAVVAIFFVFLKEEMLRKWRRSQLTGTQLRRVILVGTYDETHRLEAELKTVAVGQVAVASHLDLSEASAGALAEQLHTYSANAVIISPRQTLFGDIEKAIRTCEVEGVEVWLRANFFQTQISQTQVDELYGHPMLVFRTGPDASWQAIAKTMLDFIGALLLLISCFLPMLLIAILIKFTSKGPAFFRQERAGLNGAPFTMLKFRTMVTNAEQLKQELAALNEMSGPVFKITNDPRVSGIGRSLRKWSLDELPQLINVLRGEMSLVGPRPLPLDEVKRFDDVAHRRRLSVKPGLTCLWQVSGRSNLNDFREWVRLDLEYIDNWSIWLDLKILWRTVPAVFSAAGAR
ncbi:MAG: sugar transferase [Pedosphaera sp.]|nr:sugar transferase [Pedosphaera sp.]